eukprot:1716961-Rhodomonas_salina.2
MFVSLAPYPCRPPASRSLVSSKLDPAKRWPITSSGMYIPYFSCLTIGIPLPSFVMVTCPFALIFTLMFFILGSRW